MNDIKDLAQRYIAVWNEPDAELRRKAIAEIWTEDALQMLQPPEEVRTAATGLGVTAVMEARGHDGLEVRVTRAYDEFVAPGEFLFKARDEAERIGDIVKFSWSMVPAGGGEAAGGGLEIVVLGGDGRIRLDHQFID